MIEVRCLFAVDTAYVQSCESFLNKAMVYFWQSEVETTLWSRFHLLAMVQQCAATVRADG